MQFSISENVVLAGLEESLTEIMMEKFRDRNLLDSTSDPCQEEEFVWEVILSHEHQSITNIYGLYFKLIQSLDIFQADAIPVVYALN